MEKKHQQNEEIDLFELFGYIKKGFEKIGNTFLRFFSFLLRNIVWIVLLLATGIIVGYFIDKNTPERQKAQAVVTTYFSSAEYLYNSVQEIKNNIQKAGFLKKLGFDNGEIGGINLKIEPVISTREISDEKENFFELLEKNESLSEEEYYAIIDKSYDRHKLILFYHEGAPAEKILVAIIDHMRENPHYSETYKLLQGSLDRQIKSNIFMLAQIDSLLANYSTKTTENPNLVYSQNSIDMGELLKNRMEMLEETRNMQQQKIASNTFLKIIDMDVDQPLEETPISDNYIVFLPVMLLLLFFLVHILLRINSKAKQYKKTSS